MPDFTPAIELRHATKRYGETVALDDVSMVIEPGEFFCLLGPSGCGKTTTLNLIGGFIPISNDLLQFPFGGDDLRQQNVAHVMPVWNDFECVARMTFGGIYVGGIHV